MMQKIGNGNERQIGDNDDERNLMMLAAIFKLTNGQDVILTADDIKQALDMQPSLLIADCGNHFHVKVMSYETMMREMTKDIIGDIKAKH